MKVKATLKKYGRSARKVREIAQLIKGMNALQAQQQLQYVAKGCALDIKALIASAVANGANNHGLSKESLYIQEVQVNEAGSLKRWMPRAFGKAAKILKRSCHVTIVLDEKVKTAEPKTEPKKAEKQVKKVKSVAKQ